MKTHIIQLETHDDPASVRDKMAWGKTARILLVWPEKEDGLLSRRIDLLLLSRRASELGSQLALVARGAEVRFHAGDLGIPVFRSIAQAQASRWLQRRPDAPADADALRSSRPDVRSMKPLRRGAGAMGLPVRLAALAAGVLAVLATGLVLAPGASITLRPERREQSVAFTAVTGPSIEAVNPSGSIPTRVLTVVVEGVHTVDASGRVLVPADPAAGDVLFTNLTNQVIEVPEGTVVLTGDSPPQRYRVTKGGSLAGEPGATLLLPVSAIENGPGGNVPAGALVAVEGLLGLQLSAANPGPILGGTEITLSAPTALDRSRAAAELRDSLREAARDELLLQLAPDDILLSETPFLVETHAESYLPEGDSPSDVVEVTLRLEFRMLAVPWASVEQLARVVLDAGLPEGFEPLDQGVEVELLSEPRVEEDGTATWQVRAWRPLESVPAAAGLLPELLGLKPEAAGALLAERLDLAAAPEIRLSPAWWPRLPLLPIQIEIVIDSGG